MSVHDRLIVFEKKAGGRIKVVDYPFVSVIVPVLNREKTIGACLDSLLNLDYPQFEVIVVDGGSRDRTREIIAEYSVKLLIDVRRGVYAARNTGVKAAKGEMVFFTDSDCIADRNALKNLVRNFAEVGIEGVGGQISSYNPTNSVERFADLAGIVKFNRPKGPLEWNRNTLLSGGFYTANAIYRKRIIEEVGGFDEDFTFGGGDYDFAWRIQRAGYRLTFDPEAIVYHAHRSTLSGLVKQFFGYGEAQALKLKKQERSFYIDIKTYVLPTYSYRCGSPFRALMTIDFFNLSILLLLLASIWTAFLPLSLPFLVPTLLGTLYDSWGASRAAADYRWLILYPSLHIVRHFSWFAGKLCGSLKHRVITA